MKVKVFPLKLKLDTDGRLGTSKVNVSFESISRASSVSVNVSFRFAVIKEMFVVNSGGRFS